MKVIQNILILSAVLCMVFIRLPVNSAHAAEPSFVVSNMRVSPILLKIQLEPGTKHIYPISIENLSSAPMPIRANTEGFDPSDEQSGFTPNPPSEVSPLATWITIDEPDAIIPARDSHEFFIKISIPDTVPIGGYYAIIYFTPLYPNGTIGSKIGVVTLANIGIQDAIKNKAQIVDFRFDKPVYEHGPITGSLRIQNDALHYFSTKPSLSIKPYWGASDTVELDEKTILPGKSRSWKSVFTIQNSKWGIYNATITAIIEGGDTITKTIPLIIFPHTLTLYILLVLSCLLLIIRKRKNVQNALRVLVNRDIDLETNEASSNHSNKLLHQEPVQAPEKKATLPISRIDPTVIIQTLQKQEGSVSKTARVLGIHRSTIHRWVQKAQAMPIHGASVLKRKSTRPIHTRTSTVPKSRINQILVLHTKKHMTARQIKEFLQLPISERTILRVIKKSNAPY